MIDRGIIKWQPFNSCYNSIEIMKEIEKDKEKIKRPILSEDELDNIEREIVTAYNLKLNINIEYYYDGSIKVLSGKINFIDKLKKELFISQNKIYFAQILKIEEC